MEHNHLQHPKTCFAPCALVLFALIYRIRIDLGTLVSNELLPCKFVITLNVATVLMCAAASVFLKYRLSSFGPLPLLPKLPLGDMAASLLGMLDASMSVEQRVQMGAPIVNKSIAEFLSSDGMDVHNSQETLLKDSGCQTFRRAVGDR